MSARALSDQAISVQAMPNDNQLAISFRLLLGLYAIIPLCLLLQLFDGWFWNGALQQNLPTSPKQFLLFQILFGTPHIVASSILLVSNTEYLKLYKLKIILMTAAIVMIFGVGSLFIPYKALYLIAASWTVYHVLKQQIGVGRGLCRLPDWAFYLLLWLSVAAGIFVYIGIFLKNSLDMQQVEWIKLVAGGLCVGMICSALLCQRYATTATGKWFLWSNVLLVLSSFYLFVQQYYFLAILVPRLVHDATAYVFYVVHDYNKHRRQPQNFMYRYAARFHLPIFIVLPICSFLLAFVLQRYGDSTLNAVTELFFGVEIRKAISVGLLGYLALMHYYTEAFTWKQGSPYRRFIAFSKSR
ncbi:MAG: hypothetical protein ISR72_03980 [Methylobacter sp.]|nr:hypothetical protein [Methylobacter sp.]